MKFKIGDNVRVLNEYEYFTDDDLIPDRLIIHGNMKHNEMNANAEIVAIHKEYYIVNFINELDDEMQLGYKEDNLELISNEFVFPERWYIRTENNITGRIIGKWFDDQAFKSCYKRSCLGDCYHSHNNSDQSILKQGYLDANFAHGSPKPGYTEITFDQFKQYVMMKDIKTTKEPIFEVDKWYKINNCWYAKFNCITESNKYWKFSERITSDKEYHDDHSSLENYKDFPIELLTDLSEIQQYLPDGHDDKSLVGRYVKALKDNPRGIAINKGEYALFTDKYTLTVVGTNTGNWSCSSVNEDEFEIMPKRFKPCKVKSEAFELNESHIGKYVSLTYGGKHYDKVWVTREDNYIYLLNNCHSNNDGHSNNRNTFQFSLRYDDFRTLNVNCNNIQLLDSEKCEPPVETKPHEYTAEEALAALKAMGFKKGVRYVYMYYDGTYSDTIYTADYDPEIHSSRKYIDCAAGYLWHIDNPSVLHKGPLSELTTVETVLPNSSLYTWFVSPIFQAGTSYQPKSDTLDYSKPETLLTKTTLNY